MYKYKAKHVCASGYLGGDIEGAIVTLLVSGSLLAAKLYWQSVAAIFNYALKGLCLGSWRWYSYFLRARTWIGKEAKTGGLDQG